MASQITKVSQMDQFLRLADAIRVNNFGSQVGKREKVQCGFINRE